MPARDSELEIRVPERAKRASARRRSARSSTTRRGRRRKCLSTSAFAAKGPEGALRAQRAGMMLGGLTDPRASLPRVKAAVRLEERMFLSP